MKDAPAKLAQALRLTASDAWIKAVSLIVNLLAMTIVVVGLSSCTSFTKEVKSDNSPKAITSSVEVPQVRQKSTANMPPKSLVDMGEYGENVYDMAKANDWTKAAAKLSLLKESAVRLKGEVQSGGDLDMLTSGISKLSNAVTSKNRETTMREANQITFFVANLTAPYKLAVPIEVTKLDYYGRELEIWSAQEDVGKLQTTATQLRRVWDAVRPAIEAHKGAAEAIKFGDLVAKIEHAKTPNEYARLATPLLDEVDNLEKVFHK